MRYLISWFCVVSSLSMFAQGEAPSAPIAIVPSGVQNFTYAFGQGLAPTFIYAAINNMLLKDTLPSLGRGYCTWFKWNVQEPADLVMTIESKNTRSNTFGSYHPTFLLFEFHGTDMQFDQALRAKSLRPIRACEGVATNINNNLSGISSFESDSFASGYGTSFVADVKMSTGITYYLVVQAGACLPNAAKKPLNIDSRFSLSFNSACLPGNVLLNNISFASGESGINGSNLILDRIADGMKADSSLVISIVGHTDNQGDSLNNCKLSLRRATAVLSYLIQRGVAGQRISCVGLGSSSPLYSNSSESNRAKNRRVEVRFSRKPT